MKVGVDLEEVGRFRKIRKSDYHRWEKFFTRKEWDYAFRDAHSTEHLAGIFAAKEAAMKAAGKVSRENYLRLEILHKKSGEPKLTIPNSRVSISHTQSLAIAVVLLK